MDFTLSISLDQRELNETLTYREKVLLVKLTWIKDFVYMFGAVTLLGIGLPGVRDVLFSMYTIYSLGNLITIVVMRHPAMRDGLFSMYIISLCISNILLLTWCIPRFIVHVFLEREIYFENTTFCILYRIITSILVAVANWHLVVISVVRLVYITDKSRRFITWYGSPVQVLFLVTIVIAFIDTPLALLNVEFHNRKGFKVECFIATQSVFALIQVMVQGFIPALLLLALNLTLVILHLGHTSLLVDNKSTKSLRRQLIFLVLVSNLHYIITYLPFAILLPNLHRMYDLHSVISQAQARIAYGIGLLIMYTNNGTNFLVYAFFGRRFRKVLFEIIKSGDFMGRRRINVRLLDSGSKRKSEAVSSSIRISNKSEVNWDPLNVEVMTSETEL